MNYKGRTRPNRIKPVGYYVYAYLRRYDYLPYYIGKGKEWRAWDDKRSLSVPCDEDRISILAENLTEEEALELEKKLIKSYGREDIGTGILFNKSDGGETQAINGIERAKLAGKFKGRAPTARRQKDKILSMVKQNFDNNEIMLECKISRASYYRILNDKKQTETIVGVASYPLKKTIDNPQTI